LLPEDEALELTYFRDAMETDRNPKEMVLLEEFVVKFWFKAMYTPEMIFFERIGGQMKFEAQNGKYILTIDFGVLLYEAKSAELTIPLGEWTHVLIVFEPGERAFVYMNEDLVINEELESQHQNFVQSENNFLIGKGVGLMKDFVIYNNTLNDYRYLKEIMH
jgi:hypothetical protein